VNVQHKQHFTDACYWCHLHVNCWLNNNELQIWGKAQRESTRRWKSDWGENSGVQWISPSSKVTWPQFKCISVRRTSAVDFGWVKMSCVISGISGPKFTNFLFNTAGKVVDNAIYRLSISICSRDIHGQSQKLS